MEVGEERNGKEAACDRSLVDKLNEETTTSFSGKQMGREEGRSTEGRLQVKSNVAEFLDSSSRIG
jgi:hypothetical protein